jgi:hypothetical protein
MIRRWLSNHFESFEGIDFGIQGINDGEDVKSGSSPWARKI